MTINIYKVYCVAGVSLTYCFLLAIFFISIGESFFTQHINKYNFKSLKHFKELSNNNTLLSNVNVIFVFLVVWFIFSYGTLKVLKFNSLNSFNSFNFFNIYFYFFTFNILISLIFLNLGDKSIINKRYLLNINVLLFTLLYIYTMSTNYIVLLLSLETITTLYYFFFLKTTKEVNFSLIKYKNLISYYLWLSFFTLLFFSFNLIVLTYSYGTLNFLELRFFNLEHKYYILLLIAFFWKLGVPLFHFFKLELYRYLDFISLVLFSIISLSINSFILLYF